MVRLVTRKGQTVLDPFSGSGTTALACMREGRRVVCVDKSEEYMELAWERVELESEEVEQVTLEGVEGAGAESD